MRDEREKRAEDQSGSHPRKVSFEDTPVLNLFWLYLILFELYEKRRWTNHLSFQVLLDFSLLDSATLRPSGEKIDSISKTDCRDTKIKISLGPYKKTTVQWHRKKQWKREFLLTKG